MGFKNFFKNVGHELGVFVNKTIPKVASNVGHFISNVGETAKEGVSTILHGPENLIKSASQASRGIIREIGTGASQVLTSAGVAIKETGITSGVAGLTLPLLGLGGALIGFSMLRR